MGITIYRQSIKINLGKFFSITGTALIVIAAGVLSYAVHEFQEFGAIPGDGMYAWNWVGGKDSVINTLLSGTIGIGTSITWVQLVIWALYLGTTLRFYLKAAPRPTPVAA